ncbi:MAG TPA: pitrilysin family protein [Anaeromyxobacteraceae bacterium]|nr:pitrilysin family protein [Anaeromyxobacteraceae bacterium]
MIDRRFGDADRARLPNGVRVLTVPAPALRTAMIAVYVRAGSRHEARPVNGVSHFLEHLFFRGSEGYPDSNALNALVEGVGGSLNGLTARDHGCYYTPIHPSSVGTGLAILGDLLRRPLLRDVAIEREIILAEILDEVDADGRDIDPDNIAKRLAFGRHPLGYKIAGTRGGVRRLRERDFREHHARCYTGANLVVAVAGPVRPAEVNALAEEHFGRFPKGRATTEAPPPRWPAGPRIQWIDHDDAQVELELCFPCPPEHHPDFPVHLCLRRLLDDGLSSRLPFEVVERRGLAYSLHASIDTFADAGLHVVDGACAPSKASRTLAEILNVLGRLSAEPVPVEELRRAQRRHRIQLEFSLDSAADLVGWWGTGEVVAGPERFEDRCRRVEAVSVADVQRVARETFTRSKLVAVLVGSSPKRERAALERLLERADALPA